LISIALSSQSLRAVYASKKHIALYLVIEEKVSWKLIFSICVNYLAIKHTL
jgi:hypothetical protein